jgi:ABC-type multidrug transport system fused ATPase/permease subunit
MYREFWQLFKEYGHRRMAALICVVTVAVSLLEGFNIGLLIPLLETLEFQGQGPDHWVSQAFARMLAYIGLPLHLGTILPALVALVVGIASLKYMRMVLVAKLRVGFIAWIRSKTLQNLLGTDISHFHRRNLGNLTATLTTQADQAGNSVYTVTEIVASLGVIVAYLLAAFLISPVLAAVALAMLVVVSAAMQYHLMRARTLGTRLVERNNELHSAAVESLSGIRVIKSFMLERLRWTEFHNKALAVAEALYHLDRNRSQIIILQEVALLTLVGGIVLAGAMVLRVDFAVIITLLFILYRLTPRVSGLNTLRQSLGVTMASLHHVKLAMDESANPRIVGGDKPFENLHREISLKNLSFSYGGGAEVLRDANFVIKRGEVTAIIGTSGAGKSTVIDLILRFHDPAMGSLLVDGIDLRHLNLESWRRAIGVVSQDVFLFNDTIANNIAMGQPGADMELIQSAAQRAYAHEFIQQLPQGYNTVVGDRGWNLSGGQRQRVALARAILRNPQILILDEATSSLDSESEQVIQDYIQQIRGTCTIVVVAHRMSTIQCADKIVVLQDGKIAEEGNWSTLLAEAGVLANYHRLQLRS